MPIHGSKAGEYRARCGSWRVPKVKANEMIELEGTGALNSSLVQKVQQPKKEKYNSSKAISQEEPNKNTTKSQHRVHLMKVASSKTRSQKIKKSK